MTCKSCQQRREMMKRAYQRGGLGQVAKEAPKIGRDILKNPPRFLRKDGKPLNGKD